MPQREAILVHITALMCCSHPIILKANKEYKIKSIIKGPTSWYGKDGQTSVKCQGVRFTFRCSAENSNGTDIERGQFPEILFSVPK